MAYTPPQVTTAVSWALNSWIQLSDQRSALVYVNIIIKTSSALLQGQSGLVIFDVSDDNAGTNQISMSSGESGLDSGLLIPGSSGTVSVFGNVPVAKFFRLRTSLPVGTLATFTSRNPNTGTVTSNTGFGMYVLYG